MTEERYVSSDDINYADGRRASQAKATTAQPRSAGVLSMLQN